jgi:5-methylcytosine-specific restriction endonuclease McrA
MPEWVEIRRDEAHIARERVRARDLRRSRWWRERVQQGVCHYCRARVPPAQLTMDHVVPVARGGRSTRGNVVPCCPACNRAKRALTPAERALAELDRQG